MPHSASNSRAHTLHVIQNLCSSAAASRYQWYMVVPSSSYVNVNRLNTALQGKAVSHIVSLHPMTNAANWYLVLSNLYCKNYLFQIQQKINACSGSAPGCITGLAGEVILNSSTLRYVCSAASECRQADDVVTCLDDTVNSRCPDSTQVCFDCFFES